MAHQRRFCEDRGIVSFRYSFLIPTAGRQAALVATLRAIAKLDRSDCEVLVVVDGGTVKEETMRQAAGPVPLRILQQARAGPGAARNRAASASLGEWLILLDDDCSPDSGFLAVLDEALPAADELVGGVPRVPPSASIWSLASHVIVEAFVRSRMIASGQAMFLPSQNLVISREAWTERGGFDPAFQHAAGEDREFCARWIQSGGRLRRVAGLGFVHDHPLSALVFLRKHWQYGRGAARFRALHPQERLPAGRFARELLREILASGAQAPLVASAVLLSQAVAAAGRWWGRR